jgi:hypothetical protein
MKAFTRQHAAAVRGYGRLVADAAIGVTGVVEALHDTISRRPGLLGAPQDGPTRGTPRLVYAAIRAGAGLAGHGLDAAVAALTPWLPEGTPTPGEDALRAAVNGVYGDHLAATGNPLAIEMALRRDGRALALQRAALAAAIPHASSRVVVLVHGLCRNDRHWQRAGHDHGAALARDLGCTPLYLHYNSGLRIADNAREFAALLEQLVDEWPVPLDQLAIIGHSMGGLVARDAVASARGAQQAWPERLRQLVFLGTPHHGAPLERLGSAVEAALRRSPYSAPFARLGAARSAGINDLHHGSRAPLPDGIDCYAIAATLGERAGPAHDRFVGDGLVPLDSALGRPQQSRRALAFHPQRQWIARRASHLDLLSRPAVYAQVRDWLARCEPLA